MSVKNQGVGWDLTEYFQEFNGSDMQAFEKRLNADIAALLIQLQGMTGLAPDTVVDWESLLLEAEDASRRLGHLSSYLECLTAAHADREEYGLANAALERLRAEYKKIEIQIVLTFKGVDADFWQSLVERPEIQAIVYALERFRERANFSMTADKEVLASDLNVDGIQAWGRLYDKVTGKLSFAFTTPDGITEQRPISQWRSLMSDRDRKIGRAAFEGGNRAWKSIADICAAALNAIAGTRLSLYQHSGQSDFLNRALFQAGIKRETLETMYAAIHSNIDIGREILRQKARFFDRNGIWFFEREAPLPLKGTGGYTWQQATDLVATAFDTDYPALADYLVSMLNRQWIDSERRPAKRPGAFCTDSALNRQQRVFMTFNGTLGNVTTLAHEVGHAWHSHLMRDMRPWAVRYPMTLAETASIFAEHILAEGIYSNNEIPESEKFLMLDEDLSGAAVLLLDITTRFEFEKSFYQRRREGELTVSELKKLMVETQHRIYGNALLDDGADPYFWASKLHFYITDTTFYNFPYTFGFLLARAMTDMFRKNDQKFLDRYEAFLKLTGSDSVENVLLRSFAVDIRQPAFWENAIRSLNEPLQRYKIWIDQYSSG